MTTKPSASFTLANLVLDARALHQRSYDWAQSLADIERTQSEKKKARLADPDNKLADIYIQYGKSNCHTMDMHQAAVQVCAAVEPELAEPVYCLMIGAWNESGDWATQITGRTEVFCAERIQWEADMNAIYDKYADSP